MKLIICNNYDEVSRKGAEIIKGVMTEKSDAILGLATGSTPVGMYNILADMYKTGDLDFSETVSFNLDEYYPLSAENDQSYHYFMQENLFSKINIKKENTHILDGMCDDPRQECEDFEALLDSMGGVDIQVLGIGQNGHIGFNEPSENLSSLTHLTELTTSTIEANSRFFESKADVPTKALTMGIGTILKAKKIILLATGASKHEAVKTLLSGVITTDCPASMLNVHRDVTLICDKAAYSNDRIGVDLGGTQIKLGVVNEKGEIIHRELIDTVTESEKTLTDAIADMCKRIMADHTVSGVGVGTPGLIEGGLVTATNLPFKKTDLAAVLTKKIGLPVTVSNDANCAALGEVTLGSGKDIQNMVMISLGTGVGGGIIINNKIYEGTGSAGEIGHIVIVKDGKRCGCGLKGCFEQYGSAKALVESAKEKALENKESILGKLYEAEKKMNGIIFFKAISEGCPVAKCVLDEYLEYLAIGIKSINNVLHPEMFVLSGGITNAGALLLDPLRDKLEGIDVEISMLKSDAGMLGAALL